MAALDYAGIVAAAVAQIRDDPAIRDEADAGRPVHVTDQLAAPTMEQCPAVQVVMRSAARTLTRIGVASSAPSNETVTLAVTCWAFSAQDGGDAARQRGNLTRLVIDALERDRTLAGTGCLVSVPAVDCQPIRFDDRLFATATVTVHLLAHS